MLVNESDVRRIQRIKEQCDKCKGKGYFLEAENSDLKIVDCSCIAQMGWECKLSSSNIPKQYQTWDISQLDETFRQENAGVYEWVKEYVTNLKNNIENGESVWFASGPGLGKSSIISYILRKAMGSGYDVYYSRAAQLQDKKFDAMKNEEAQELIDYIVNDVQILAIEELEKVYLTDDSSMPNYLFYQLVLELYDAKKAILISTNKKRDTFLQTLPSYVGDRLATFNYIPLIGKSRRKR